MSRPPVKPLRTVLARALYDNEAEFPNELSFNRADVVTVIQRDPDGCVGWWLCSLNGQVGIVPGNRFELLGVVEPKKRTDNDYDNPMDWGEPNRHTSNPKRDSIEECSGFLSELTLDKAGARHSALTDSGNYSNRSSEISLGSQLPMSSTCEESELSDYAPLSICFSSDTQQICEMNDLGSPCTPVCSEDNGHLTLTSSGAICVEDGDKQVCSAEHKSSISEIESNKRFTVWSKAFVLDSISRLKSQLERIRSQLTEIFAQTEVTKGGPPVWNEAKLSCEELILTICDLSQGLVECAIRTGDMGLVRRFRSLRKTFAHAAPRMRCIIEELSPLEYPASSKQLQLGKKLTHILSLIAHFMAVLENTTLANSTLILSDRVMLAAVVTTCDPSPDVSITDRTLKSRGTSDNAVSRSSDGDSSRNAPDHIEVDNPQLNDLCRHCTDGLEAVQQFIDLLCPEGNNIKSPIGSVNLDPDKLTNEVKRIMLHGSELINSLVEVRIYLSGRDSTKHLRLAMELQRKGTAACETLKGLLIQAKEVRACLAVNETRSGAVPGPLLQRLIGAGKSVHLALTTILNTLNAINAT